ncbi:MAG: phosphoribosyltransferase [Verrucomicrobiota bacterium]
MNNALASDYIWGIGNEGLFGGARQADIDAFGTVPIKAAIRRFLDSQIQLWKPDRIIVLERKGTAVLRALMESEDPIRWRWEDVVSSKVIEQLQPGELSGKRILIFDDMMKKGVHLAELLRELRKHGVDVASPDHLRVAVFAVHEESSRGTEVEGTIIPHAWYRRCLNTQDYTDLRTQIVTMLQHSGSLMLDTEHLEIRVNIVGNFDKFVKALRRTGRATVFTSAGSRVNITVLYEDDTIHLLPTGDFPDGTKTDNIVKKCRVVQRSGSEFALIPICFPSIPAAQVWHCKQEVSTLLGRSVVGVEATDSGRFYGVGLRAALRVLRWVLRDLYAAAPHEFTVSLPGSVEHGRLGSGYHLGHLRVMYPTLDVGYLNKWIARIEREAQSEGSQLQGKRPESSPATPLRDEVLYQRAIGLLQMISDHLDRKRIAQFWRLLDHSTPHPFGLTAEEVFQIGEQHFRGDKVTTSTLFDILIDQATLVTHVQPGTGLGRVRLVERTFEPDGEIVSEAVRRYTTQWGLPDAID